jgi:hypothetical protein
MFEERASSAAFRAAVGMQPYKYKQVDKRLWEQYRARMAG